MRKRHTFTGQRVLITGGGSGIGRLLALGAAQRGAAKVVIWDISAEAGNAVRQEVESMGAEALAQTVDVSDHAKVAAAAAECGDIDILVNNAGVVTGKPFLENSPEAVEKTFAVNVLSLYWVTRAFLPGMIKRKHGKVVTVASAAAFVGVAKQTDYSASKFAAFGFNESLRAELASTSRGVHTLVVCPYYIDTGMFEGVQTRVPWLLPILKPEDAVRKILIAMEQGKKQLVMPSSVGLVPILRILPVPLFDRVMNLLGINHTMDHFTGRK